MPRRSALSRRNPAAFVPPMKALGVSAVPPDGDWHCEVKFDGYRAIAVVNGGEVELWSRNHKPLAYPEVVAPLARLKCGNAVLDGEIVALDAAGRSDFQTLQGRDLGERPTIAYYVFDLLHLDGESLTAEPIEERQKKLGRLLRSAGKIVRPSPVFDVPPADFFATARRQGLEGMVLKRRGSPYEPGLRSGAWVKVKHLNEQEFVIGGFTPPRHSRQGFGAILIGYFDSGRLLYCGKVGSGYSAALLQSLHRKFLQRKIAECPFANLPLVHRSRFGPGMTRAAMRTVTWIRPDLVAQVKFAEWTVDGLLRQPVFLGLRTDKQATSVRREAPAIGR